MRAHQGLKSDTVVQNPRRRTAAAGGTAVGRAAVGARIRYCAMALIALVGAMALGALIASASCEPGSPRDEDVGAAAVGQGATS